MDIEFRFRLRDAMARKRINATELSRLSGVGKGDISHYLKGNYLPKQDKCYLLANALDVDPGWLMTGIGPDSDAEADPIAFLNELEKTGCYDVIDIYQALSEEGRQKAKSYLLFLKAQEEQTKG